MQTIPLNERQAIQFTFLMWDWLARHPFRAKEDYLAYFGYGDEEINIMNDCWLCSFVFNNDSSKHDVKLCKEVCPLIGLWPPDPRSTRMIPCCNETSPYTKWEKSSDIEVRRDGARTIADYCIKLLRNSGE
jgi:hypothetical protein